MGLLVCVAWLLFAAGCRGTDSRPRKGGAAGGLNAANQITTSPNGKLSVQFRVQSRPESDAPVYAVSYAGRPLIANSPLALVLDGQPALAGPFAISHVSRQSHDERYEMAVPTKTRYARDHYNQTTIDLEEANAPRRKLRLIFRAYDDGIAFRYVIPQQPGMSSFILTDEQSNFRFAGDPTLYAQPLKGYDTPHEAYFHTLPASGIENGTLLGLPLLLSFKDGPWMAITEADLTDYAGMYLTPSPSPGSPALVSALAPWPGQTKIKVKGRAPMASPWRVIMVADDPGRLIESNLVCNLNPPCALADRSWIHTGKVAFPWWNGYMVPNQPFKGGLNTATMKYYIDFCAANGIEFHSIDGTREAWYGGPVDPWQGADITRPVPGLDMPEVLAYAKAHGVRTRLWMNWAGLQKQMDQALDTYQRWGVDGIMVDFMNRNDQEMVNFYHVVAAKAAAHHLTVNFHGAYEPTGMRRTYPNVLNFEGVLNLEYNKWSTGGSKGVMPEYDLTVPFIRMLAGPLDFHSGGMRSVRPSEFKAQWVAPLVMGTRSHELARYVVYENPLPMLADDPSAYRGQVGLEFLRQVPTTWDATRVLAGEVGQYIVIARRHGRDWYLGAMNGGVARRLTVPLSFLGDGRYAAEIYADDGRVDAAPTNAIRRTRTLTGSDSLEIQMSVAGGEAVRFGRVSGG